MEGTTEPIVAVIGHPIAGNPSQFALERSLHEMNLDWRVLSLDVQPDDVAVALEGFLVTGIVGVLIDPSVAAAAVAWCAEKLSLEADHIDCLHRDDEKSFIASDERILWLQEQLEEHGGENRIRLGEIDGSSALVELAGDAAATPPDIETINSADQIFLAGSDDEPVDLDVDDWPENDGKTLVIDLTDGHPQAARLQEMGYRLLSAMDFRIGTLQRCLKSWTGETPSSDVIHDAIEEYLAV